jgi:hypothetical protein
LAAIATSVQSECITTCEIEVAQPAIIPAAKALYLCDGCIGFPNQKTDLIGLFNSIRPNKYPHVQSQFVVFAQLLGGLGQVPCYIDIRYAATDDLVHTTATPDASIREPSKSRSTGLYDPGLSFCTAGHLSGRIVL